MKRGIDTIGVGVGAILVDEQGRLFLARRGLQAKNECGLWEFPGGSVEFGERLVLPKRSPGRSDCDYARKPGALPDNQRLT